MTNKQLRIIIAFLTGFIALTAIGGGIAILTGADQFPEEWLLDTPFKDYTVPAVILAGVVGGSALIATIMIIRKHPSDMIAAVIAGVMMMGHITIEVIILKQEPPGPTPIEIFYFTLGLLTFGVAGYLLNQTHNTA